MEPARESALARHRQVIRQFAGFTLVGFGGLFVDMGALWFALNVLHAGPWAGRAFSYLCAATFTWVFNRQLTFKGVNHGPLLWQWFRYLLVNALGGVANLGVYSLIVAAGPSVVPAELHSYLPYIGVGVGSLSGLVLNFAGSKLLVFR